MKDLTKTASTQTNGTSLSWVLYQCSPGSKKKLTHWTTKSGRPPWSKRSRPLGRSRFEPRRSSRYQRRIYQTRSNHCHRNVSAILFGNSKFDSGIGQTCFLFPACRTRIFSLLVSQNFETHLLVTNLPESREGNE